MKQIIGFFLVVIIISAVLVVGFCEELVVSNSVEVDKIKATATPTPEPTPEPTPWNVSVKIELKESSYSFGDKVTLISYVTGVNGLKYHYQWQKEVNGQWIDTDGRNETYTFTLTEETASYRWRLAVTVND